MIKEQDLIFEISTYGIVLSNGGIFIKIYHKPTGLFTVSYKYKTRFENQRAALIELEEKVKNLEESGKRK